MFQGFYNLTAGMLTEGRTLNVISSNIANATTAGYKKDTLLTTTFKSELANQVAGKVGNSFRIRSVDETITTFSQGGYELTEGNLDFALFDKGFFTIQGQGGLLYTRDGSFITDDQGFLSLPGIGRVMGRNGPIQLNSDDINVDNNGTIYSKDGAVIDTLAIVDFPDYNQLNKVDGGVFEADGAGTPAAPGVIWKSLERSNVDMVEQMTNMMSSQRALQSASQVLKMYDQLMAKATTEIGRV